MVSGCDSKRNWIRPVCCHCDRPHGLGNWERLELRAFISGCVETGVPIFPVLLPGVLGLPSDLRFLKELNWVQFRNSIAEEEVLSKLEWGILGTRPSYEASHAALRMRIP